MPVFGRGFPSKFKPFGVIAGTPYNPVTTETITNTCVASQTLTSAESQFVNQSGNATQALSVEATTETQTNVAGPNDQTILEATAETESSSGSGSQVITDLGLDSPTNSGNATLRINEAEAQSPSQGGTGAQNLSEATAETVSNSASSIQFITEKIYESVLGSEIIVDTYVGDDFNRADGAPGSNWTTLGSGSWSITSNQLKNVNSSGVIYWNQNRFTDVDFSWTRADNTVSTRYSQWRVALAADRTQDPTTTGNWSGYYLSFDGTSTIRVFIYNGSFSTQIGSNITEIINQNDSLRVRMVGSNITLSKKVSGSSVWDVITTLTDSTYTTGGRVWFESGSTNEIWDNFVAYEVLNRNAQNTQTINTYNAEATASSGTGSNTSSEAVAETVSNSAASTIAIDETIDLGADALTNTGTATIRINEAEASSESGSGSGSPSLAEAITEIVTNHGGAAGSGAYGEGAYGEGAYGEGSGGENQTILEAIAETDTNTGTASFVLSTTEVASEVNTGTGTQTFAEATAETVSNSATATIAIDDIVQEAGDDLTSTGTATLRINEALSESESGSGTGDPTLAEATAEAVSNSATDTTRITEVVAEGVNNIGTNTPAFNEQTPEINLTSVALSTQSLSEAISEALINSATSTQTFAEAEADSLNNSAIATHSIASLEVDSITNSGSGTPRISEATAETDGSSGSNDPEFDESTHITVVPFSDLLTGTWTVDPLYEKVDEFYPIGGYPTESIRSASNPVNDKAILGLAPVSDPGIDTEHYINIQFYKQGDETLDFTVNLKEGSTLIATRTFTDVTETQSNPRLEKIALTSLEASAIVDYSNLNIELIANQTS